MNCVDYAINRVVAGSDIDPYLLDLAFKNPNANYAGNWMNLVNQTTVEQGIREKVIHRIVLPACNVAGGKTEYVSLSGSRIVDLGNMCIEVNVPDTVTGGRKIVSITEVYLGAMNSASGMLGMAMSDNAMCGQGSMTDMVQGLIDGVTSSRNFPITYTNIHMKGNNCFVLFGVPAGTYQLSAKCVLEYDSGLSSISPRHFEYFAKLVELAVKGYIYKHCKRPTAEAVMRSGIAMQDIKDDIMEFRDAWTQYEEYLNDTWRRCMAYSDRLLVHDTVSAMVPRRM